MKRFAIVGWKNSGKTTLVVRLVREFTNRGLAVSTLKHAHHAFDIDRRGRDSYRHREAGASEVLVMSDRRWAMIGERREAGAFELDDLLAKLSAVDLLLIEGFKSSGFPKLESFRRETGVEPIARRDPSILAIATDAPLEGIEIPMFELDDIAGIARFILRHCSLESGL